MVSILLTLNAIICIALVIIILLQRSDPASGGMFGGAGGGTQPVVRNPLARPTAVLAALFLVFSVVTAMINKNGGHETSVMNDTPATQAPSLPEAALMPVGTVSATTTPTVSTTIITTPTTAPSPTN